MNSRRLHFAHQCKLVTRPERRRRLVGSDVAARLRWIVTSGQTEGTAMPTAFGTAIEAWDARWTTVEGRVDWLDPEPDVVALLPELKARGVRNALDLGCGVGRHAVFLAEHGLTVEAIDGSAAGLAVAGA